MRCLCLLAVMCVTFASAQDAPPKEASTKGARATTEQEASPDVQGDEAGDDFLDKYRAKAIEKWKQAMEEMESRDANEEDPSDAILFTGSSSIRRWDDIAIDMAPYRTIQRGFGGSKYSDVAILVKRLIHPHQYRALVIFVGNDVSGRAEDKTPEEVERLVRYIVGVSHAHQPEAPVLLIEVTPTEKRFAVWPQIRQVNARLREVALSTANTYVVTTAEHYLDPNGNPRNEFFADDRLHLNSNGYDRWANLIRSRLDEVFRATAEFHAELNE